MIVDISKSCFASMEEREKSYCKFYVYNIESLATTFREYKTIRLCEFFPMANIIVNPSPKVMLGDLPSEEDKIIRAKMEEFCEVFKNEFNQS